jgi:hypothetical protein
MAFWNAAVSSVEPASASNQAKRNTRINPRLNWSPPTAPEAVQLGAARNVVIPEDERRRTVYHEAGHALLGMLQPGADPVRKVRLDGAWRVEIDGRRPRSGI